jgi:hypothetical protein
MYDLSATTWRVGALFFGLRLFPMGWCAIRLDVPVDRARPHPHGRRPRVHHQRLVDFLVADASGVVYALTIPATIGELWMVGSLLLVGLGPRARAAATRMSPGVRTYRPAGARP